MTKIKEIEDKIDDFSLSDFECQSPFDSEAQYDESKIKDFMFSLTKDYYEIIGEFENDFEYLCKQLENFDDVEYRSNFESEVRCLFNKYKSL